MRDKLTDIIPEFLLIKDDILRENALQVWIDAMREGKWEIEDLKDIPSTLHIKNCPVNLIDHTRAVAQTGYDTGVKLKEIYAGKIALDIDYLICGGLLHDVGKLLEYTKKDGEIVLSDNGKYLRHPLSGVGIAYGKNIPDEVLHIIGAHSGEGDFIKRTPEAVIVNKLDFMNTEIMEYFYK
ncbi:MAG: HD domain-containing protein [Armatimonadota bacterium]